MLVKTKLETIKMVKLKTAFTSEIDKIFNIYEITIVQ